MSKPARVLAYNFITAAGAGAEAIVVAAHRDSDTCHRWVGEVVAEFAFARNPLTAAFAGAGDAPAA